MDEKIAVLSNHGTWELVTRPTGAIVVTCRWVYTVKYRADGTVDRYKARLIARGFTQIYGVNYVDTFSPVTRPNSIRVLLSIAINNLWELCQLDVKNVFLYGRFCAYGVISRVCSSGGDRVCKLKKAIYGLKQSSRASGGFQRCDVDHSVFYRKTTNGCLTGGLC